MNLFCLNHASIYLMLNTCVRDFIKLNDYKSIALPAELQGHDLICKFFSLISQSNQQKKNSTVVRSCCCSHSVIPLSTLFVTDLSVLSRCENPISYGISIMCFHPLKIIKSMEWKNDKEDKIYTSNNC